MYGETILKSKIMIKKIICNIGIAICISSIGWAQTPTFNNAHVEGIYRYLDKDSIAGIRLELNRDGTFKYLSGGDLQSVHSSGTWKLKGDTVIINSAIDAENIPVTIKEKRIDSLKNRLTFAPIKNLDGEIVDALLYFNKDTASLCDPVMENGCIKKVGSVKSVKIEFTNEASTKWYKLKSKKANLIEVTANVHDFLALYLYFKNEQYLLKDGTLQYIPKDNTSKGEVLKRLK